MNEIMELMGETKNMEDTEEKTRKNGTNKKHVQDGKNKKSISVITINVNVLNLFLTLKV